MSVDPTRNLPVPTGGPGMGDMGSAIGETLVNVIQGVGGALSGLVGGIFQPIRDGIEPIRDAQLDLNNRTDLLEGVQGYAHAYMSKNINAAWSLGNNWRMMPFDTQLGPALGAYVRSDGRVVMESEGLWLVFAKVHGRNTGFVGEGGVTLRVRVYLPDGTFHMETYTRGTTLVDAGALATDKGSGSLISVFPVVVDEPGCYVRVDTWTAAWRWWDGGTQLSSLSVLKQSNNVSHPGDAVVPDETESEAGA